jgi:hypothetical protein
MEYDTDYRNRLGQAIFAAIVEASKGEGDVPVIKDGPAFDALIMVAAVVMARSPNTDTPQKIRLLAEETARKLRKQIAAARADGGLDGLFAGGYVPTGHH